MAIRFAVVVLAATVFLTLDAHAQTGCLSGNVVDNAGAPVPGIRITIGDNVWTLLRHF
jgi:hypothetical protein